MISIAIQIMWFLIGLIALAGIIYLALWVIESFIHPIPERVKQAVWVIVLLLALIALLSMIAGGGSSIRFPSLRGTLSGGTLTALSAPPARYHEGIGYGQIRHPPPGRLA